VRCVFFATLSAKKFEIGAASKGLFRGPALVGCQAV